MFWVDFFRNARFVKTAGSLLLLLFCLQILEKIVFTHSHVLPSGDVVVHAHPYVEDGSSPSLPKHSHSKEEFFFYELLNSVVCVMFVCFFVFAIFVAESCFFCFLSKWYLFLFVRVLYIRPPPLFFA